MFHLIWYVLIGLISGVIAKSVMHVHITMFWTIALGIIGSILGGAVTHMFLRPRNERYHPAGLIFSTLGAILILYICFKLKIHFPQVQPRIGLSDVFLSGTPLVREQALIRIPTARYRTPNSRSGRMIYKPGIRRRIYHNLALVPD